ncbi:MAG: hypothetical protein OXC30_05385 [Alphaproteobacteria bacterium]|nr:hypothetical protein [Alphaproteobacteria bacterium]
MFYIVLLFMCLHADVAGSVDDSDMSGANLMKPIFKEATRIAITLSLPEMRRKASETPFADHMTSITIADTQTEIAELFSKMTREEKMTHMIKWAAAEQPLSDQDRSFCLSVFCKLTNDGVPYYKALRKPEELHVFFKKLIHQYIEQSFMHTTSAQTFTGVAKLNHILNDSLPSLNIPLFFYAFASLETIYLKGLRARSQDETPQCLFNKYCASAFHFLLSSFHEFCLWNVQKSHENYALFQKHMQRVIAHS